MAWKYLVPDDAPAGHRKVYETLNAELQKLIDGEKTSFDALDLMIQDLGWDQVEDVLIYLLPAYDRAEGSDPAIISTLLYAIGALARRFRERDRLLTELPEAQYAILDKLITEGRITL